MAGVGNSEASELPAGTRRFGAVRRQSHVYSPQELRHGQSGNIAAKPALRWALSGVAAARTSVSSRRPGWSDSGLPDIPRGRRRLCVRGFECPTHPCQPRRA